MTLIVADYSNQELRLLAHFTQDPQLLKVYRDGESDGDLHGHTAKLLGLSGKDGRKKAKVINFAISYGAGPYNLANELGVGFEEAKAFLGDWYMSYSLVKPWKDNVIASARKNGFVRSLLGRKRRVSNPYIGLPYKELRYLTKDEKREVFSEERQIVNFVIQGSGADILKLAINALEDEEIIMAIHDEVVIRKNSTTAEEIAKIMEGVVGLSVPMKVDAVECENWGDGK